MYTQGAPIKVGNLSIANVTSAPAPAGPPAPINGQVMCSLHKKTRAMRFVQQKSILNAEGAIVGYTYHCTEASPCLVGGQRGMDPHAHQQQAEEKVPAAEEEVDKNGADNSDFDIDGPSQGSNDGLPPSGLMKRLGYDGVRTSTAGSVPQSGGLLGATGGAIPKGLFGDASDGPSATAASAPAAAAGARFSVGGGNTGGRAPSRYYDMAKSGRDDDYKKVCWSCGMDSHEKPACPNLLCRNCHDAQEPGYEGRMNHRCSRVGLSAFVLLDTDFLDNFMAAEEVQRHNAAMKEKAVSEGSTASAGAAADSSSKKKTVLTFDDAAFVNPSLLTTRCPRCNQLGHMDCPHPLSAHAIKRDATVKKNNNNNKSKEADGIQRQLSCCGCASSDHSGYECPSRPRDYWRERVLNAAAEQLGMDEVRALVAIDERVPLPGRNNTYNSNNNAGPASSYGAASSYSNSNNRGGGGGRVGGEVRPFGMSSAHGNTNNNSNNRVSGVRRGRHGDESDDGWSDDERSPRRPHRGEYDRSYPRNNTASKGRNNNKGGGRGRLSSDDDNSDYSYSDDDKYDGRRRDGGNGGKNSGRNHQGHQGRLDHRDHGRNTPSSFGGAPARGGQQQYQRPSYNGAAGGGGNYYAQPSNAATAYRAPHTHGAYSAPSSSSYANVGGPQQSSYGRPNVGVGNSYSAPYGNPQYSNPSAHHQYSNNNNNNQPRYSRPPQPPANSQPGRGQYNRRGFEF